MIKRIHVNQHNIRANNKGAQLPVLSIKTYKQNITCNSINILGPSKLVYQPEKPLSCGAKVWIETSSPITVEGKTWK